MKPGDHLVGKDWLWTAGWPNGPEVAAPPPPVSGGAAQLPNPPQVSPHFAYSGEKKEKDQQPNSFFAKRAPPC